MKGATLDVAGDRATIKGATTVPPMSRPYLCRATTAVLVAVTVVSGGMLLLGDRFGVTPGYALRPSSELSSRVATCVAEENGD